MQTQVFARLPFALRMVEGPVEAERDLSRTLMERVKRLVSGRNRLRTSEKLESVFRRYEHRPGLPN